MQLQTTPSESKFPDEYIGVIFIQIDEHLIRPGFVPRVGRGLFASPRVIGLSAVHAIGLNSWTDTQRAHLCPL